MSNKYNHKNRRKCGLKAHIVLVTEYRKPLLQDCIANSVKQKTLSIANRKGYKIIAMETDRDHIHLLLEYDR